MSKKTKQNKSSIFKQKISKIFKKITNNLKKIICISIFFLICIISIISYKSYTEKQHNKYINSLQSISYKLVPLVAIDYEIPSNFYVEKKEEFKKIYFKFYFMRQTYMHTLIIQNKDVVINYHFHPGTKPTIVIIGKVKDHNINNFESMKYIIYVPYGSILTENFKEVFKYKLLQKAK